MSDTYKAACVQNCATADVAQNIAVTLELTREAAAAGASLICLPEYFSGLETIDGLLHPAAFPEGDHPVLPAFSEEAKKLGAWILLGSLGVKSDDGRIFNRSYLLDASGTVTARYDKIHMFDVNLGAGKVYRESATIAPGSEAVIAQTPWGGLGLSICYDLRFAPLYRTLAQAGASMLAVPAAFTKMTGQAHWHILNRARAIEHGCFVIAPCQYGTLVGGGECYGHSLIIDPWGEVLADGGEGPGVVVADIDPQAVSRARGRIPALEHDRMVLIKGDPKAPGPHAKNAAE
ncbi:carbon-nitrogen hydrolase family protein [Pelagibius sp. Alg239-R121]|uniref:carbon-nitrogen hydrolase family protein n=1 Tax=Pelagibius sp. Alg239-R121 TaxID=2993448 RepID=UPI0024A70722|nr:carbon-nitrogen hydrolase family protein [Pelagibius sp. Alg239-R121]